MRLRSLPATFALTLLSHGAPAGAAAFSDAACPNATPIGQHLNALVDAGGKLNDDLVATAQQMVDAYASCERSYDSGQYNDRTSSGAGMASTNGNIVNRLYTRLQLARSWQRVAQFALAQKRYGDTRTALEHAKKNLAEMPSIETLGVVAIDSPDGKLLAEGRELLPQIDTALTGVPQDGASPASSTH